MRGAFLMIVSIGWCLGFIGQGSTLSFGLLSQRNSGRPLCRVSTRCDWCADRRVWRVAALALIGPVGDAVYSLVMSVSGGAVFSRRWACAEVRAADF